MPRPSTKKVVEAVEQPRRRRRRRDGVREQVLSLLVDGSKTGTELKKIGGFSGAALYRHIKVLRKEKLVETEPGSKRLRLTGASVPATPAATPVAAPRTAAPAKKKSTTLVPSSAPAPSGLHEALEAVAMRFLAPDHIGVKLTTLEQLARTMPAPVAEVLGAIHADYLRMSPARGQND